jgi:hypothetical protein
MVVFKEQIQGIKAKLPQSKKVDSNLKVFGAESHQYRLGNPATEAEVLSFEQKYAISLPACYRAFISQVGNGGISFANSAAGPFYGIYPLGENVDEPGGHNTVECLNNDCVIFPDMPDAYWQSLNAIIDGNENIPDEVYEKELSKIFGGILPIGSQGCAYIHGIVLNGDYRGRVVNLDLDRQKPRFAFEKNFLDWYERWLDEVISGELLSNSPSWFGYTMGGSITELLNAFQHANAADQKIECLKGILNKQQLDTTAIKFIEDQTFECNGEVKTMLLQVLSKFDYEKAKPYLIELAKSDLLSVAQFIYWYAKDRSAEWFNVISENIAGIDKEETLRYCTYLLKESNMDYGHLIIPFTQHNDEKIRAAAYYALGQLDNKKELVDTFINGLHDNSNRVILNTLQALSGVKDAQLLEHYKRLAEKFPEEQDYILSNLNHRLEDYGLTNRTILD